jgi:hypothetical protein
VVRLLERLRLAEVLTKVDEGWEDHRRRIPRTVVSPLGAPAKESDLAANRGADTTLAPLRAQHAKTAGDLE